MKKITILLDEGHYDGQPGKRSPKFSDGYQFFEWQFTRKLGQAIKNECDKLGIKCIRTTDSKCEKSLTARANNINRIVREESELGNSSLMISLHGNAAGNGSKWANAKGWEVYSTVGTTNSDKFAKIMCEQFKKIFPDRKLRGHKEKNFTVIYKTACPCVLTENFFYDNEEECNFIRSRDGFTRIVKLHVESIKKWVEY